MGGLRVGVGVAGGVVAVDGWSGLVNWVADTSVREDTEIVGGSMSGRAAHASRPLKST